MDGRFLRANWAGPRLESGAPSTWWLLDLGPAHALVCNYYTLRHDASTNFLRSWALQACSATRLRRYVLATASTTFVQHKEPLDFCHDDGLACTHGRPSGVEYFLTCSVSLASVGGTGSMREGAHTDRMN